MGSEFYSEYKAKHSLGFKVVCSQACVVKRDSKMCIVLDHIKYLKEIQQFLSFSV